MKESQPNSLNPFSSFEKRKDGKIVIRGLTFADLKLLNQVYPPNTPMKDIALDQIDGLKKDD